MSRRSGKHRSGGQKRTLLLIGDTLHARDGQGRYCTFAALARQLDQWFAEFDHVVIAASLVPEGMPPGFLAYEHQNISFIPLARAGGPGLRGKVSALIAAASWVRSLVPLIRRADVVHLRAPCNVTVVAIPLARVLARHRYAIYAGAWDPPPGTPLSYTLQRWMLRRFGGIVHVYAPAHAIRGTNLRPNVSPSFTGAKWDELAEPTMQRLDRIRAQPPSAHPLRVSCVGRFTANKNQGAVVQAVAVLRERGIQAEVRFAGDGPARLQVEGVARRLGIEDRITVLGQCDEGQLEDLYTWADVNVMPSFAEGFGRVILEGMALGCPAVCGPGAMQEAMIGHGSRGRQVDPSDPHDLAEALMDLREQSFDDWASTAAACRAYARSTTVEVFDADVRSIVGASRR